MSDVVQVKTTEQRSSAWTGGLIRTPVFVSGRHETSLFNCLGHFWVGVFVSVHVKQDVLNSATAVFSLNAFCKLCDELHVLWVCVGVLIRLVSPCHCCHLSLVSLQRLKRIHVWWWTQSVVTFFKPRQDYRRVDIHQSVKDHFTLLGSVVRHDKCSYLLITFFFFFLSGQASAAYKPEYC